MIIMSKHLVVLHFYQVTKSELINRSKDPRDWTEDERQAKLDLLVSLYPPAKVGGKKHYC